MTDTEILDWLERNHPTLSEDWSRIPHSVELYYYPDGAEAAKTVRGSGIRDCVRRANATVAA